MASSVQDAPAACVVVVNCRFSKSSMAHHAVEVWWIPAHIPLAMNKQNLETMPWVKGDDGKRSQLTEELVDTDQCMASCCRWRHKAVPQSGKGLTFFKHPKGIHTAGSGWLNIRGTACNTAREHQL